VKLKIIVGGAGAAFLCVVAVLAAGVVPWPGATSQPSCDALSTVAQVDKAISDHAELVASVKQVAPDVSVETVRSCGTTSHKAALIIRYSGDDEQERIDTVLSQSSGFGVPVQLKER
jgi:hypothetical protein